MKNCCFLFTGAFCVQVNIFIPHLLRIRTSSFLNFVIFFDRRILRLKFCNVSGQVPRTGNKLYTQLCWGGWSNHRQIINYSISCLFTAWWIFSPLKWRSSLLGNILLTNNWGLQKVGFLMAQGSGYSFRTMQNHNSGKKLPPKKGHKNIPVTSILSTLMLRLPCHFFSTFLK